MSYVPARLSEVVDFLSYMILYCPDEFEPEDRMDCALAFSSLRGGLDAVRARLGEERYRDLVRMADEAKALYDAGDDAGGAFKLEELEARLERR